MPFKDFDVLEVHYSIRPKDGELFFTTDEKEAVKEGIYNENAKYGPATIIIGRKELFPKVEERLKDAEEGQEFVIELEAKDAYGERTADNIEVLPIQEFRKRNIEPFPGLIINADDRVGRIQSVSGGRVRIDFNHPMAGKTVQVKVKVLKKLNESKEIAEALAKKFFDNKAKVSIEGEKVITEFHNTGEYEHVMVSSVFAFFVLKCCPEVQEVRFVEVFGRDTFLKSVEKERKQEGTEEAKTHG